MFGKEKRINPLTDHQDVLIQVVKDIELTKKCVVSANSSYLVMILVDNKPICTIKNCRDKVIYKEIGKEYLGSLITILFVLNTYFFNLFISSIFISIPYKPINLDISDFIWS